MDFFVHRDDKRWPLAPEVRLYLVGKVELIVTKC